jgi:N-acetyl-alpha-D-glucosaminyl L-malate synthase BshA
MAICPHGEKLLVHTSNFRKVKRVEDVVRTFKGIKDQIPAKLLLVGDGPERSKMENLCRELQTCQDVRFLGKLDTIEEVLSVSDLFLMPSEKESFGLAALEAMACEVPVVSSNAGGIPELNLNGITGFTCEVGDVEDMIAKSLIILQDDRLPEFRKAALARASEFDIHKVVPHYEEFYRKVMEKSKPEILLSK